MKPVAFSKYSGAGNDFILVDNRACIFSPHLVPSLCHRQEGIGADGVILLNSHPSNRDIYKIHIYNADGSTAEMCGNGIRCFTKFLWDLGITQKSYRIENIEGKLFETSITSENQIFVAMAPITNVRFYHTCHLNDQKIELHILNTGVPHVVVFVPNIENIDVEHMGRALRHHPDFQPKGTNANFVMIDAMGDHTLHLRTYERGVEHETLACGTGACAAAITAAQIYHMKSPITIKVRSKALLTVHFQRKENAFFDLVLEGPAKKVFEGSFFIP